MLRNRVRDASGDQKIRKFAETRRSPADFGDRGPKKAVWGPKKGPKGGQMQKRFFTWWRSAVSRRPVALVIGRNRRLRRLSRTLRSLRKRSVRRIEDADASPPHIRKEFMRLGCSVCLLGFGWALQFLPRLRLNCARFCIHSGGIARFRLISA